MITVRQIEKWWKAKDNARMLVGLCAGRSEVTAEVRSLLSGSVTAAAALAVVRLDELMQGEREIARTLLKEIIAAQESDGGWIDPAVTSLAVRALACSGGCGSPIERGLAYLAALQRDDGLFPAEPLRRMPGDEHATAFVLINLAAAGQFGLLRVEDALFALARTNLLTAPDRLRVTHSADATVCPDVAVDGDINANVADLITSESPGSELVSDDLGNKGAAFRSGASHSVRSGRTRTRTARPALNERLFPAAA